MGELYSLTGDEVLSTYCYTGADVIHPAPGSDGRPSFTALVANVDSDTAKYVAGDWFFHCHENDR